MLITFFSPSNIVTKSLEFCGIDRKKIKIVPYGVNINKFQFTEKKNTNNKALKLIYVGQISYSDNIGQRIPPVALQRIPVVSLKGYRS